VDYGGKTDKYTWDQDETEVTINFPIPENTKARDIECIIKTDYLKLAMKGKIMVEGKFPFEVLPEGCTWTIEGTNLDILLAKPQHVGDKPEWWKAIVIGEPEIDVEAIEASKYLDDSILRKIKAQKVEKAKQDAAEKEAKKQKEKEEQEKRAALHDRLGEAARQNAEQMRWAMEESKKSAKEDAARRGEELQLPADDAPPNGSSSAKDNLFRRSKSLRFGSMGKKDKDTKKPVLDLESQKMFSADSRVATEHAIDESNESNKDGKEKEKRRKGRSQPEPRKKKRP